MTAWPVWLGVFAVAALAACRGSSAASGAASSAASGAASGAARHTLFSDPDAGAALRAELAARPAGPVVEVHRVWTRYLASTRGRFDCRPSDDWVASEQEPWTTPNGQVVPRCHDLAGAMLDPRQEAEVLRIEPVPESRGGEYRITTRFRAHGLPAAGPAPRASLVTVFAVREGDRWKLAGALGRLTRLWRRETVGPFTYVIRPGHRFSRDRAQQAVAFADSAAAALGVPRLGPLDYYVVRDGDEMLRVTGYEPDTTYGMPGGRALPGIIMSGDPAFGEKHGHEIAHHLIRGLQGPRLHVAASEGVPTWLGGTRGMAYPDTRRALRAYLVAHPAATLDTVLASNAHPMHNPGAALLSAMAYERGGVSALRRFLDSGPSAGEFKAGVAGIFGVAWSEVAAAWKRRALAASP